MVCGIGYNPASLGELPRTVLEAISFYLCVCTRFFMESAVFYISFMIFGTMNKIVHSPMHALWIFKYCLEV